MTTPTKTLIEALRILARDIQSEDGVANAVIGEAADRLEQQEKRIRRLEQAGDDIFLLAQKHAPEYWLYTQTAFNNWRKAKEANRE